MRPFLLVGCGGSGGTTLQYLMDQLSADLARFGVDRLPAAWQFVHIDVPTEPDSADPGMPPVITEQNPPGSYVGLATPGSSYATIAGAVSTKLAAAQQLPQLATWWADPAREPAQVAVQIGAGQRRSIGRVVTLSGLGKVRDALGVAYEAMMGAEVTTELHRIAELVSPGTESQAGSSPVIIIVSSMAGGAGASMVLDVCRLVSTIPRHDVAQTALFLYTPEVFDSLSPDARSGVPANALAMTGELVATQLGAATADDAAVFQALGLSAGPPGGGGAFGRVFPVGSRIGDTGGRFGDDHKAVYRGLGRGLAGLLLSGQASRDWVSFDLGNPPPDAPHEHGGVAGDVLWGSFGFAQLSLGRDRYAEYAAQRLARSSVERLVDGHVSPGAKSTELEQLNRLVDSLYGQFLLDAGLPGSEGTQNWFRAALGDHPRQRAGEIVAAGVEPLLNPSGSVVAAQWIDALLAQAGQRAGQSDAQAQDAAYAWVHGWAAEFAPRLEQTVSQVVSLYGVPTATALLERLSSDANGWVQELREGGERTPQSTVALEPRFVADVRAHKGQITAAHGIVTALREACLKAAGAAVTGRTLALLAELMANAKSDLVDPLRGACEEANSILRQSVGEKAVAAGLAQLKTDQFVAWPKGGQPVPSRFMHSQNEVLLIDSRTFEVQFDEHLLATTRADGASTSARDGLDVAVGQVVRNRWETTGPPPTAPIVVRKVSWRSAVLPTEPGRRSEVVQSRRGQYELAVKPAEILERSRSWVERPGTPFHAFVNTSLRAFVDEAPESERTGRSKLVEDAFRKALHLAQPLVAVNSQLVSALTQAEPQVNYKFSEVPFGQLELADDLVRAARQGSASTTSVDALQRALRPVSQATRIDVFGSFRPLPPVAFSSLLAPLASSWAAAVLPADRAKFLRTRRSRRLAGAVAMSDQERLAFVGGWYVARLTGRLRLPGESHAQQAVELWDERDARWHAFPHPLLVSDGDLRRNSNNYLPAALMSFGLALARVSATGSLQPLDIYRDLRHRWDAHPERGRVTAIEFLRAKEHLQEWVTSGDAPPGATAPEPTPVARRDALSSRASKARVEIGKRYLAPGQDGAEGGGQFSIVDRVADLADVPLFHEVAADVHAVYGTILSIVETLSVDSSDNVSEEDEF